MSPLRSSKQLPRGGAGPRRSGVASLVLHCPFLRVLMKHQVWPPHWTLGAGSKPLQRSVAVLDRSYPSELSRCYWCRTSRRGSGDRSHKSPLPTHRPRETFSLQPSLLSVHLLSRRADVSRNDTQRRLFRFCLLWVFPLQLLRIVCALP